MHAHIRTVYAIMDCEGQRRVKALCSSQAIADAAAPAFGDWHGHGSAEVVERQAVEIDGKLYLLANDHGPEVELDTAPAVQTAMRRLAVLSKLTSEEIALLDPKR